MANKSTKWIKLFEDFISKLRIDSKEETAEDDRGIEFDMWDSQRRFMQEIAEGLEDDVRTFICLKSRQLGISTISLAIDLFWLAIHPGIIGALVTDSDENRESFRTTLKRYLKSFPPGYFGASFQLAKGGDNRNYMMFTNGSRLHFLVAGKKKKVGWGEGKGFAFAHLTEVSAYGDAGELASFEEALSQKNPNRLVIYESTAKGMNHWKDKWDDAGQDVYSKRRFFIGWWASKVNVIERGEKLYQQYGVLPPSGEEIAKMDAVAKLYRHYVTPEQLAWYRWKQASARGGASQILDQNQPWTSEEAFIQTGYSFFPVRRIQEDLNRISYNGSEPKQYKGYKYMMGEDFWSVIIDQIKDPNLKAQIDLRVWEEPVEGGRYVIGCDPAFGRNEHKDRSACSVWRCYADCIVQVAEYASAMHETRQMSWVLAHLAGAYKDCIVNLEIGGPGHTIMVEWTNIKDRLRAEMYAKRVADMGWDDFLNQARWYLYHRPDSMGAGYVANFETTWRTKQVLMNQFRDSYSTKQLSISSVPLLNEMVIVVQDGAQIGAPESSGEHAKDDRVFAAALANRAWIDWVRPDMIGQGLTYESVMALESGEQTKIGTAVNRAVANYFKRMEELADLPVERGPQWMIDRGLI